MQIPYLRLVEPPVLISLQHLEGDFLKAGDCASDADYEDDRDEGEGRVQMPAQHDAERRGVPVYPAQPVAHKTTQPRHYSERAQTFGVILWRAKNKEYTFVQTIRLFMTHKKICKFSAYDFG